VLIATCNRHVKFGLKIPNRLGKNARKPQGVFLDSHCIERMARIPGGTVLSPTPRFDKNPGPPPPYLLVPAVLSSPLMDVAPSLLLVLVSGEQFTAGRYLLTVAA